VIGTQLTWSVANGAGLNTSTDPCLSSGQAGCVELAIGWSRITNRRWPSWRGPVDGQQQDSSRRRAALNCDRRSMTALAGTPAGSSKSPS
jgi:hypothetical protein